MARLFRSILLALVIITQGAASDDSQKVVLTYQGRQHVNGQIIDVFTVGKDRHILLGLAPLDSRPPLSPGDMQICSRFTQSIGVRTIDGNEYGGVHELGFLCSGKRYVFTDLDIH